jgi:hypothetical protein
VALCLSSSGLAWGRIEASIQRSRELFACCMAVVPRMLLSYWNTSPTQSTEGAGNISRSAAAAVTFWLALAKAGGWCTARSFDVARRVSNIDSPWSRSTSLAFVVAHSPVSLDAARSFARCHSMGCVVVPPDEQPVARGSLSM